MFGKKLQGYIRFEGWILILIAIVFVARLAIGFSGTPVSTTRWISINIVLLVGLVYCAVAVHTKHFGSYRQLLILLFLQGAFAHILIALAIVLGILTGVDNIYTAPEFFEGANGRVWGHVGAHLAAAVMVPVVAWLIGSVFLFITKKLK